jgi:hypothetical protein
VITRGLYVITLLLSLLAACSPAGEPASQPEPTAQPGLVTDVSNLDRTAWWLSEVRRPNGELQEVASATTRPPLDLYFFAGDDVRSFHLAQGFAGCSSFGMRLDLAQARIFAERGGYEVACEVGEREQHALIMEALKNAAGLRLTTQGQLEVLDDSGEVQLSYRPKPVVLLDPALAETEWTLISLKGETVGEGNMITLSIAEAGVGWLGGETACGVYDGEIWQLDEGVFEVPEIVFADTECPENEAGEQSGAYRQALEGEVMGYRLAGRRLTLLNSSGEVVAIFQEAQENR